MISPSIVEKVARVLCRRYAIYPYEEWVNSHWEDYVPLAETAIAAHEAALAEAGMVPDEQLAEADRLIRWGIHPEDVDAYAPQLRKSFDAAISRHKARVAAAEKGDDAG